MAILLLPAATTLTGCVTKAKADAQARAAYFTGQQTALARIQQIHGPSVTLMGEVVTPVIPWNPDLTLTKALIAADYRGPGEPNEIVIVRGGRAIRVDPRQLLNGTEVPLLAGDLVEIHQPVEPTPPPPSVR